MIQNELTPLDELHQEKAVLKQEYLDSEERLTDQWSYVRQNIGSIIFYNSMKGLGRQFGLVKKGNSTESVSSSSGFMSNMYSSFQAYGPMIWEITKPLLMKYAFKKIKNIFSSDKKKDKNNDN